MFATSSQRQHWLFSDEDEVTRLKQEVNEAYIELHGEQIPDAERGTHFLTVAEQDILVKHNELALKAFCKSFSPPMPPNVMAIAMIYLKRVYLKFSTMDYHPRDIIWEACHLYLMPLPPSQKCKEAWASEAAKHHGHKSFVLGTTCVYLACKVDEFNVSLREFVGNLKKDREKATDIILWFELKLMQMLNFHLTIHTAYRPLEGLIINLKTHSPDMNVESLRAAALQFLDRVLFTDCYLLYSPSQIALAALQFSSQIANINLNFFLQEHLLRGASEKQIEKMLHCTQEIQRLHSLASKPSKDEVKAIDRKLDKCRNQELNPNSEIFQRKIRDLDDDDDQQQLQLYKQNSDEQLRMEQDIMTE